MQRYFLELAYKGTRYSGFQVQQNAVTIQSELERALAVYFKEPFSLTGSSRTDAGVHANQNFFHVDTGQELEARYIYNLNALLPADIVLKGIYQVPAGAHCRFDAVAREYQYFIYASKNPFLSDRAWLYPYPVNLDYLNAAAETIKDYADFTSFSKRNTQVNSFICSLSHSAWRQEGELLIYTVRANRFLRGMVRGLVGTMVKMGRGQIDLNAFKNIIEARDCTLADFSTPPQGLFLNRVIYNESLKPLLSGRE
ncbi:MAG: tRNA pseudouridine(38-40) synthase TruA [Bacteroidota bacterium]|jgi:tRNA pseudouridine38-40 synthase